MIIFLDMNFRFKKKKGFTLIELLIVIGILVVLATVVVLILNPAQIFKEARDAKRVNDLTSLNNAIRVAASLNLDEDVAEDIVYISLPDDNPACGSYVLPNIAPLTYQCVPEADLRSINGTGWVPIDFTGLSTAGVSLPVLPIDPINTADSGFYYTYQKGSYKITGIFESQKYQDLAFQDGGIDDDVYEIGSDVLLGPSLSRGDGGGGEPEPEACPGGSSLVAHWDFEEGTGDTATDSANGNIATLTNGATWTTGINDVGSALSLDGNNDYALSTVADLPLDCAPRTITAWVKPNGAGHGSRKVMIGYGGGGPSLAFRLNIASYIGQYLGLWGEWNDPTTSLTVPVGEWSFIAGTYDGIDTLKLYVDDDIESFDVGVLATASSDLYFGQQGAFFYGGAIDEVRVYDYLLSDNEIQALYDNP